MPDTDLQHIGRSIASTLTNPTAATNRFSLSDQDSIDIGKELSRGLFGEKEEKASAKMTKAEPRGMIAEFGSSLGYGLDRTGEAMAGTAEMLGVPGAGKVRQYYKERAEMPERARPESLQEGTVWEHPERLSDWRWWVRGIGENAPGMAMIAAPYSLATKLTKALNWGEKAIRATARAAGFSGGFTMEAGAAYSEAKDEMTQSGQFDTQQIEQVATLEGLAVGTVNGILDTFGIDRLFLKQIGADRLIKRIVRQSIIEGSTESAQEAINILAENIGHKKPDQAWSEQIKMILDQPGRILEAGIIGGAMGGIMGGTVGTKAHNRNVKAYNQLADELEVKVPMMEWKKEGLSDKEIAARVEERIHESRARQEEANRDLPEEQRRPALPEVDAKEMTGYVLYGKGAGIEAPFSPEPGFVGKKAESAKAKVYRALGLKEKTVPSARPSDDASPMTTGPAEQKTLVTEPQRQAILDEEQKAKNKAEGAALYDAVLNDDLTEQQQLEAARQAEIARREEETARIAAEEESRTSAAVADAQAQQSALKSTLAGDDVRKQALIDEVLGLSERQIMTAVRKELGMTINPAGPDTYAIDTPSGPQPVNLFQVRERLAAKRIELFDTQEQKRQADAAAIQARQQEAAVRKEQEQLAWMMKNARETLRMGRTLTDAQREVLNSNRQDLTSEEIAALDKPKAAPTQAVQVLTGIKPAPPSVQKEPEAVESEPNPILSEAPNPDYAPAATDQAEERRILISEMISQIDNSDDASVKYDDLTDSYSRLPSGVSWLSDVNKSGMSVSKAEARRVLVKAQENVHLTARQQEIHDAIIAAAEEQGVAGEISTASHWTGKGFEPAPDKTLNVNDLVEGDRFVIAGEEFAVTDIDDQGNVTLKDGVIRKVREGSVLRDVDFIKQEDAADFNVEEFGAPGKVDILDNKGNVVFADPDKQKPHADIPKFKSSEEAQQAIDDFEDELATKYGYEEVLKAPLSPELFKDLNLDAPETKLTSEELSKLQGLYAARDEIDKQDLSSWRETVIKETGLPREEAAGALKALAFHDPDHFASVYRTAENLRDFGKDMTGTLGKLYTYFARELDPHTKVHGEFRFGGTAEKPILEGRSFDSDLHEAPWDKEALDKTEKIYNAIARTQSLPEISLKNIARSGSKSAPPKSVQVLTGIKPKPEEPATAKEESPQEVTYTAVKGDSVINNVQPYNVENLRSMGYTVTANKLEDFDLVTKSSSLPKTPSAPEKPPQDSYVDKLEGEAATEAPGSSAIDENIPSPSEPRTLQTGESGGQPLLSVEFAAPEGIQQEMDEIVDTAKKNGTYLKAPNGKATKLTPEQWAMVRTKNFKKWFGDWEKGHAKEFLDKGQPVVSLTGEEFRKSEIPLTKQVSSWFKSRHKGVVRSNVIGDVVLNDAGVRDSLAHGIGREKAAAFAAVPDIIKNGVIIGTNIDYRARGLDRIVLAAPFDMSGQDYIGIVIVQREQNSQRFYLHEVAIKKRLQDASKTAASAAETDELHGTAPKTSFIKNLLLNFYSVNQNDISKVTDPETGEPLVVYHGSNVRPEVFDFKYGAYFSGDKERADSYADARASFGEGKPEVTEVFLNIRNPETFNGGNDADFEKFTADREKDVDLIARGYDGQILKFNDHVDNDYRVVSPNQIKSATSRRGTFDPNNPDIRYSAEASQRNLSRPYRLGDVPLRTMVDHLAGIVKGISVEDRNGQIWLKTKSGKEVCVVSVDHIDPDRVALTLGYHYGSAKGGKIAGMYTPAGRNAPSDKTISLVRNTAGLWTLSHEFYHFLEDIGVISNADKATLNQKIEALIRKDPETYAFLKSRSLTERRAEWVGRTLVGIYDAKTTTGRILQKIRNIIDAIVNAFGIRTARGILRDIETGRIYEKGQKNMSETMPASQYSLADDLTAEAIEKASRKIDRAVATLIGKGNAQRVADYATFKEHFKEFWQPFSTVKDGDKVLARRYQSMGNVAKAVRFIQGIQEQLDAFPPEVKKDIFWYLNGDIPLDALPTDARNIAQAIQRRTEIIGEMLVDRGILTEETFRKHQGKYIHYMYAKHIVGDDSPVGITSSGKLDLSYTKRRNPNITMQQRQELGLIEDASVAVPVGMGKALTDIAKFDYLATIADNPDWVWQPSVIRVPIGKRLAKPIRGRTRRYVTMGVGKLVEMVRSYDEMMRVQPTPEVQEIHEILVSALEKAKDISGNVPADFVQLPNTKGYGPLAGAYVRKPIADDLRPVMDINTDRGKLLNTIVSIERQGMAAFKMGKVALNFPTAFRNVISNIIQNNMRGRPLSKIPADLIAAAESLKAKDRYYEEAFGMGIFNTNWFATEINDVLEEFRKAESGRLDKILTALKNVAKYYGKIDDLNKHAIFLQLRKEGKPVDAAALEAMKWGMDYSLTSRSIKGLRQTIMPFATYQYKIAPLIAECLKKRPWVLAKFALIYPAAKMLAMGFHDLDDDDWEDLVKQLPAYIKKSGSMMILPWKTDKGQWQWVNLEYFFPWGNYLAMFRDMREGDSGEFIRDLGISNPFLSMFFTGISAREDQPPIHAYFGTQIYNQLDPAPVKMAKYLEYMANTWMPSMLTRQGALGYTGKMLVGSEDRWGREVTFGQALGRWFGFNIVSVSPEQSRAQVSVRIQELKKEMSRVEADPSRSEEEKAAYRERLNRRLGEIAAAAPAAILPITKAKGHDPAYEALKEMAAKGILHASPPSRSMELHGVPMKMTMDQYAEYLDKSSEIARRKLTALVESPAWNQMTDKRKSDVVDAIVANARKAIRQKIKAQMLRDNREKILKELERQRMRVS